VSSDSISLPVRRYAGTNLQGHHRSPETSARVASQFSERVLCHSKLVRATHNYFVFPHASAPPRDAGKLELALVNEKVFPLDAVPEFSRRLDVLASLRWQVSVRCTGQATWVLGSLRWWTFERSTLQCASIQCQQRGFTSSKCPHLPQHNLVLSCFNDKAVEKPAIAAVHRSRQLKLISCVLRRAYTPTRVGLANVESFQGYSLEEFHQRGFGQFLLYQSVLH